MSKANNIASLLNSSGLLDSDDIGTSAITNSKIASGAIDSDAIGTDAITAAKLNVGQLGGRRNLIINGAMQVAQRGTSIACPASAITYTMDRFFARPNGSTATTVSQVTDAPDGFQYSARVTRDSGQTGTLTRFETPLETRDIIKLRGQKVTVSFYAKAGSNLSTSSGAISLILFQGNGTEGARAITAYTNETTLINSPKTLTTSWQRFTHTTTNAVASDTTQLAIQFQALWSGTAGANDEYFITGIQLEAGETATPFEHRSYAEELALCQRYYQKSYNYDVTPGTNTIEGMSLSAMSGTNLGIFTQRLHPSMRDAPDVVVYDQPGNSGRINIESTSNVTVNGGADITGKNKTNSTFQINNGLSTTGDHFRFHFVAEAEL